MKIRVNRKAAARATLVLQALTWTALIVGAGLVAWPVVVCVESEYAQWSGERELAKAARLVRETIVAPKPLSRASRPRGSVLGRFEVPRLQLSYVLLEGTDARTLDKSIGHVEGTSPIGQAGNVAIAGHRNTHFRKLEWVRRDDEIVLTNTVGTFRYRVEWTRLFTPEDVQVLDPSHGPAVTLITCFPFEYVGSAPLRFIVRALPDTDTRGRLRPFEGRQAE
jgi:LPXTG-site transpeptidase (sortase) family protein